MNRKHYSKAIKVENPWQPLSAADKILQPELAYEKFSTDWSSTNTSVELNTDLVSACNSPWENSPSSSGTSRFACAF